VCVIGYSLSGGICNFCEAGKYAYARATSCMPCPPGTYSAFGGAGFCTKVQTTYYINRVFRRYVRIDKVALFKSYKLINLMEMTIKHNGVALDKATLVAYSSSLNTVNTPASKLIDGDSATFAATSTADTDPWMYVDVGIHPFDEVIILNRPTSGCSTPEDCPQRIVGASISVVTDTSGVDLIQPAQTFASSLGTYTFSFTTQSTLGGIGYAACPVGYATTLPGATGSDAAVCDVCADGSAGTSVAGMTGCTICPVNSYSASGSGTICTQCPTGYSVVARPGAYGTNVSDCVMCAAGYSGSSSDGSTGCTVCPVGKFNVSAGNAVECTPCTGESGANPGYASISGQTACTPCDAHASNCSPADPGTCDAGYSASIVHASDCSTKATMLASGWILDCSFECVLQYSALVLLKEFLQRLS